MSSDLTFKIVRDGGWLIIRMMSGKWKLIISYVHMVNRISTTNCIVARLSSTASHVLG